MERFTFSREPVVLVEEACAEAMKIIELSGLLGTYGRVYVRSSSTFGDPDIDIDIDQAFGINCRASVDFRKGKFVDVEISWSSSHRTVSQAQACINLYQKVLDVVTLIEAAIPYRLATEAEEYEIAEIRAKREPTTEVQS